MSKVAKMAHRASVVAELGRRSASVLAAGVPAFVATSHILTEASDFLTTEASDRLTTES
jgi:hypothetical protein